MSEKAITKKNVTKNNAVTVDSNGSNLGAEADSTPRNNTLTLKDVSKSYKQGKDKLVILDKASLEIAEGEVVALVGPSGSGKTTLLQIAGLLDNADCGKVIIRGNDYTHANDAARTITRLREIGFIYQFHHLLPEFSALENVVIPQMIAGIKKRDAQMRAHEVLKFLGLNKRESHRPSELSGGEQQRVAIARAIVNRPSILLADEPTGNLDPHTAKIVFDLLLETARAAGLSVLMVTHNLELARKVDRAVTLQDGKIIDAANI
jgi:lipoprotein-releasing system ATP-binding protein